MSKLSVRFIQWALLLPLFTLSHSLRAEWTGILAIPLDVWRQLAHPHVRSVWSGEERLWEAGQRADFRIRAGQILTIRGRGFGPGPSQEFSKILFGTVRAIERNLCMYRGQVNLIRELYYETARCVDRWDSDILRWQDDRIDVRVPAVASRGPIVISRQRHRGRLPQLQNVSRSHTVMDPLTERIERIFNHVTDSVWNIGPALESEPVAVRIENPEFAERLARGEAIYWMHDFNMGLTHRMRGLDWDAILNGNAEDPITHERVNPETAIGVIPLRRGEVPDVAMGEHTFNPFPTPMPIRSPSRAPLLSGRTFPTRYIGRTAAQAIHPQTGNPGRWIGENCASCHSHRIEYEASPGVTRVKVFPGIPNPNWTQRWAALGNFHGVRGTEVGPDGQTEEVDKTQIIYHMPKGASDNALVRTANDGSRYANDYLFAPVVIPTITRHTPLRRALSRTELIVGFEGSYIHPQEPDGAIGFLGAEALKDLTAYMSSLDREDDLLRHIGMYRWLQRAGLHDDLGGAEEGQFVQQGISAFPRLGQRLERGRAAFERDCLRCHQSNFGTWSDEQMFSLSEVGTYFSPSIFQREVQSIRTAYLRNLYWIELRGLLHDGHVRSLADLVHPDRCRENSQLHQRYYTLNADTFKIPKGTPAQERALRRHTYFVDVPRDPAHLYWDYQLMRREFGKREFGTTTSVPLAAVPHPWCAGDVNRVTDLVTYLMSL